MNADGDRTGQDKPRLVRALSGGVGLLAQPRSADGAQESSLLFSPIDAPSMGPSPNQPDAPAPPRSPPNLRLDIPPQEVVRDTRPFAPDAENEGICTEVGSLGQEIQLESGDHLNALERIYLYTQSKATFHRIFMSRALPTYLYKVTPVEAVEYVLPLLGGLAIDEEERVKETFVAELLDIIWWFFTTCQVTDQEPTEESDPPFVSVQSFSAVLASLLLSSNPEVSATARGTVVELLGRTRWIAKGQGLDQVQTAKYCETMRPVEPWSRGLLGPDEARMIQLEIIYGVVIDLGRLDLNGEEYIEGADEHGVAEAEHGVIEGAGESTATEGAGDELYNLPVANASQEDLPALVQNPPISTDSAKTPTAETVKAYIDESDTSSKTTGSVSHSASSSLTSFEPGSAPASTTTFPSAFPPASAFPSSATFSSSIGFQSQTTSTATDSSSSLNLPELSPGDSSSRSSVASPTEPVSPPEGAGLDYVTTVIPDPDTLPYAGSVPSSDGETDELMWHTPRGGEGFETGYFDPPVASPGSGSTVVASPLGQLSTPLANQLSSPLANQLSSPLAGQLSSPLANQRSTSSSQRSSPLANQLSSPLNQTHPSPLTNQAYGRNASPLPTPTGLAPPRLARQDSILSTGTVDEYVDAESGEGWEDEGYLADAGEESGAEVQAEGDHAHPAEGHDEYPPETGDAFAGEAVDDAYIDDGAAAEEAAIGRVASMSLIAAVTSSGVVDEEYYTLFVEEVLRVSSNPVYWVRSETSYALGTLAKAVHEDMVESDLLPILEALMADTEAHVRQASVFAIPPVLTRLSPQRRRELASRYVLKLCEDTADSVRTGALQVLAEVIHTFHKDKDGPPDELVDFFLKGEKEQIRAPLPKSQADQKTPSAEKDQFNEWGGQSLATWGTEPSSYFEAEPSFPDADRALICAFNYPAIVLTLGPERWSRLSEYYRYLAEESWHTPKVRATLAASAGEIARVIGPRAALADVVPVWWICVSSDQRDAKIKALKALPVLLEALDPEGRAEVAGKMSEVWDHHVSGWKEREAFARQLHAIAPLLKDHGLLLCRIFKSGVEDRVAAIREVAIEALPVLHDVLKDNNAHIQVARNNLFALGASGMCRHKTIFLACCRVLVQSPVGASILDDSRFGPSILPLAEHSVIDVRIALGRLLTVICEHHMHTRNQRPHWVSDCLEKLGLDASADVRAFVHRANSLEYVEPRAADTKPKPDERPHSPPYAEFSRPP